MNYLTSAIFEILIKFKRTFFFFVFKPFKRKITKYQGKILHLEQVFLHMSAQDSGQKENLSSEGYFLLERNHNYM